MNANEITPAIKLETRPVRGKFAEWRVRLVQPEGIDDGFSFSGARNCRCWHCAGSETEAAKLTELEFFYNVEQGYVYSVCPRCGSDAGGAKAR